jgi:hypothetical protein
MAVPKTSVCGVTLKSGKQTYEGGVTASIDFAL